MRQPARVLLALLSASFLFACLSMAMAPMVALASIHRYSSGDLSHVSSTSRPGHDEPLRRTKLTLHTRGDNLGYGGGPVMAGTTYTYAIFWEPAGNVSARYNSLIRRYFRDIGRSPLYRIAHQYTQSDGGFPSNVVPAASWVDSRAYPESPVLDNDIQNEITRAQRINGWRSSMHTIFFVFTERNENVCVDNTKSQCTTNGYCAYHSAFGRNTIYAAVPYIASFSCDPYSGPNHDDADQTITGISHEQIEAATDPLGNAWLDANGNEVADKCAQDFGWPNARGANVVWNNDPYLVQEEWDNNTSSCRLTPSQPSLSPTYWHSH